ncbi:ribonuclease P protein subunit p21 [Clinocottus analis]|uniref:ribonuclease P protein subunit p21 n=1 Tax=Clinocottus analis TaxID=304258 RepID=UPI0035C1511B
MSSQMKDKEAYQRLNYLYQAAHCVLSQNPENVELARFYCSTQKTIARRLVLRQDPSVKRTLCRKCCSLLIPGVTASIRQRRKKRKARFTVVRCLSCDQSKTLLNDPDHRLWVDRPEAQQQQQQQNQQQQKQQQTQQQKQQQKQQQTQQQKQQQTQQQKQQQTQQQKQQNQQQQQQQQKQQQNQQQQKQQQQQQQQQQQPDNPVKKQPKDKKRGGSASSSKPGAAQSAAST